MNQTHSSTPFFTGYWLVNNNRKLEMFCATEPNKLRKMTVAVFRKTGMHSKIIPHILLQPHEETKKTVWCVHRPTKEISICRSLGIALSSFEAYLRVLSSLPSKIASGWRWCSLAAFFLCSKWGISLFENQKITPVLYCC